MAEALLTSLKHLIPSVRENAALALIQLGKADPRVVEALVALLKDEDSDVAENAAAALGELGQKRTEWTDERLLELLQGNLSAWRDTAGAVLAYRHALDPRIYNEVMVLRNDPRPWVRMAAWNALLRIEKAREARERDAKQAQTPESAK